MVNRIVHKNKFVNYQFIIFHQILKVLLILLIWYAIGKKYCILVLTPFYLEDLLEACIMEKLSKEKEENGVLSNQQQ
jgi:hypothetical protein